MMMAGTKSTDDRRASEGARRRRDGGGAHRRLAGARQLRTAGPHRGQPKTDAAATKVIIMLSRPLAFDVHVLDGEAARKSTRRLVLDFDNTNIAPDVLKPIDVKDGFLQEI